MKKLKHITKLKEVYTHYKSINEQLYAANGFKSEKISCLNMLKFKMKYVELYNIMLTKGED